MAAGPSPREPRAASIRRDRSCLAPPNPRRCRRRHKSLTEAAVEIGERRHGDTLVLRPSRPYRQPHQRRVSGASAGGGQFQSADIVVDLSAVDYISSAGLRALMLASRHKPKELRLAVACLNEVVREIFSIGRFSQVVPTFATVEDALAAWEAAPRPREGVRQAEAEPAGPLRVAFLGHARLAAGAAARERGPRQDPRCAGRRARTRPRYAEGDR